MQATAYLSLDEVKVRREVDKKTEKANTHSNKTGSASRISNLGTREMICLCTSEADSGVGAVIGPSIRSY